MCIPVVSRCFVVSVVVAVCVDLVSLCFVLVDVDASVVVLMLLLLHVATAVYGPESENDICHQSSAL